MAWFGKTAGPWRVVAVAGVSLWMSAMGAILASATSDASRPGASGTAAPDRWPPATAIARSPGRGTLLLFAHSRCACTRASFRELERALARSGGRLDAYVLFVGPRGNATFGAAGAFDLRATARGIPGVTVVEDDVEARRFGALTSGQMLLYDAPGRLVFRGGITPARGHEGASAGSDALLRFAAGKGEEAAPSSEVFGCSLFDRQTGKP